MYGAASGEDCMCSTRCGSNSTPMQRFGGVVNESADRSTRASPQPFQFNALIIMNRSDGKEPNMKDVPKSTSTSSEDTLAKETAAAPTSG